MATKSDNNNEYETNNVSGDGECGVRSERMGV